MEKNYKLAMDYFQKASLIRKHPSGYLNIAYMYFSGLGVEKDYKKTVEYLKSQKEVVLGRSKATKR